MSILLPANANMLREAARYLHQSSSWSQLAIILIGFLGIVLFCLGLQCCESYRQRHLRKKSGAKALFLELCKLHRLSWAQRNLLTQAATQSNTSELSQVFVDPQILRNLSMANVPDADAYRQLLTRLFGERESL